MMNTIEYRVDCQVFKTSDQFWWLFVVFHVILLKFSLQFSSRLLPVIHFFCWYSCCNTCTLRTSWAKGFLSDWRNRLRNGMRIKSGSSMSVGIFQQMQHYISLGTLMTFQRQWTTLKYVTALFLMTWRWYRHIFASPLYCLCCFKSILMVEIINNFLNLFRQFLARLAWKMRHLSHLRQVLLVRWPVSLFLSWQVDCLVVYLRKGHLFPWSKQKIPEGRGMLFALQFSITGPFLKAIQKLTLPRYFSMNCFRISQSTCSVR